MGKFKTDRSAQMSTIRKAHKMAEAFAEHKTDEFLDKFLDLCGVDRDARLDFKEAFGGAIALSYAMGFVDASEGKVLKTLYVPGDGPTNSTNEPAESKLILPGFEK